MVKRSTQWAYPWWGRTIVSLFVLYHVAAIAVALIGSDPAFVNVKRWAYKLEMSRWIRASGSKQKWNMFAPDPRRRNEFLVLRVESADGRLHPTGNDIQSRRTWPYLIYDRHGKINRRLLENTRQRRVLAAYYCREWEREHGGRPARAVHVFRRLRSIPPPADTAREMDYDPGGLPVREDRLETVACRSLEHGQLPPDLRERFDLPPAPPGSFRDVTIKSWADVDPPGTLRRRERTRQAPRSR